MIDLLAELVVTLMVLSALLVTCGVLAAARRPKPPPDRARTERVPPRPAPTGPMS